MRRVLPLLPEHYDQGKFPAQLIPRMAELGIYGANLPEEYGCANLGDVAYGLIMQELERGDSGIRSAASVQGALVMYPIFAYGSEEQKSKWLPKLATGEAIGCFGLTEPDFGSNPGGMETRARKTSDGWVLNGRKMWITNGTVADVAVVWAKVEDGSVKGFLVEKGTPGFSAPEQLLKFSLRCSVTSELVLDDVHVSDDALMPGATGLKHALGCLTQARYGIAWGAVGAASACFDEALRYSQERIVFDKPLAGFQLAQKKTRGHGDRDHQGADARPAAGPPEGGRSACPIPRCRWPSATTCRRRSTSPGLRATCSAPTASSSSTNPGVTCVTSRPSTPTKGPTTSTRSPSARN